MRAFSVDKELGATFIVGWNHTEFEVPYHCLADEIKIGEIFFGDIFICPSTQVFKS